MLAGCGPQRPLSWPHASVPTVAAVLPSYRAVSCSAAGDAALWTKLGVGSNYTKAQYRQYTDDTFQACGPQLPRWPRACRRVQRLQAAARRAAPAAGPPRRTRRYASPRAETQPLPPHVHTRRACRRSSPRAMTRSTPACLAPCCARRWARC